jgi:SAM-dependent methyltransferase
MKVEEFAENLCLKEPGLWMSKSHSQVSYPEDGNNSYLSIEESSFWFRHRNRCILEAMGIVPPEGFVLDIGGGNGFVALAIEKAGWDVGLMEPGGGAFNARSRGLSTVINSTFENAGLRKRSIPAIGLFDVVEHIEDDLGFLLGINQVLIPGGVVYITVPAYNFLWSSEDDFAGHFRRYSQSSLLNVLRQAGLTLVLSAFIFAPLPPAIFLCRVLPEKFGFRKSADSANPEKYHKKPNGVLGGLLDGLLSMESKAIRRGYSLPFGGSLLAVARSTR